MDLQLHGRCLKVLKAPNVQLQVTYDRIEPKSKPNLLYYLCINHDSLEYRFDWQMLQTWEDPPCDERACQLKEKISTG